MPLNQSGTKKALKANIGTLMGEVGKSKHVGSRAQALAIAFDIKRRNSRARGGKIQGFDTGGAVQDVINALQGAASQPQSGSGSGMQNSGQQQNAPAATAPPPVAAPPQTPPGQPAPPAAAQAPGVAPPVAASNGVAGAAPAPSVPTPVPTSPQATMPVPGSMGNAPNLMGAQLMNTGGTTHKAAGGANMAKSPNLQTPWTTKQEARSMMHTGPILSTVPGRTDNHRTRVPSGSYVLPAAHIASMGEGNSVAGLAAAHSMFGGGGPYGSPGMRIAHGPGAPKPPRMMKFAAGGGEHHAADDNVPVDVMLAGGEYVIPPHVVRQIGKGSLKNGHAILDRYVMAARKKEIDTQRKLPPPAKK